MKKEAAPVIHIIAGPNGAGKTTFAREFLPEIQSFEFLNADLIAAGLSPLCPEASAYTAGKLLLKRWQQLANEKRTFAFESTLSGRTYATLLRNAKANGYLVRINYLWLSSVSLSLRRIKSRVSKGGHVSRKRMCGGAFR